MFEKSQIQPIRRVSVVTQVPILGLLQKSKAIAQQLFWNNSVTKKLLHFSVSQVHSQNYHLVCADTAVHIPDLFSTAEVLVHILVLVGGHTQLKARFTQLLENLKTIELPGGVELSI